MSHLSSTALKNVLRPPSAVANALDWKKARCGGATAMAIDVHADRIGLALATLRSDNETTEDSVTVSRGIGRSKRPRQYHHREQSGNLGDLHISLEPCSVNYTTLDSISLIATKTMSEQIPSSTPTTKIKSSPGKRRRRKRIMPPDTRCKLADLVHDHDVCAFVVSWPVQQDTGLMGASCGRTLWALEQILEDDDNRPSIFRPQRPLCLWNGTHHHQQHQNDSQQQQQDAFGRLSVYARTSSKTEHRASTEQYFRDESIPVVDIWQDFFEHHWPTAPALLARHQGTAITTKERMTRMGPRYSDNCVSAQRRTLIAV